MIQSLEVQIVQENNNKSSSSMKMVHLSRNWDLGPFDMNTHRLKKIKIRQAVLNKDDKKICHNHKTKVPEDFSHFNLISSTTKLELISYQNQISLYLRIPASSRKQ